MKRIDPAAVPDVFKRLGLVPIVGDWVADEAEGECCVLSALYCDAKGCEDTSVCLGEIQGKTEYGPDSPNEGELLQFIAAPIGLDPEYASGVYCGWDNGHSLVHESASPERKQGHIDGFEARKACEAAGILELSFEDEDDCEDDDLGDYSDWLDGDVYDDEDEEE